MVDHGRSGGPATVEITWLGQAGFAIHTERLRVLIDPFVSEHELRLAPPPPSGTLTRDVDWLLITHEHLDHLDPDFIPILLESSPRARIVAPAPLRELLEPIADASQLQLVQPGQELPLGSDAELEVIPACHAVKVSDGYAAQSAGGEARFVGYLLRFDTVTIYHAGDTLVTKELIEALSGRAIDVALLPINGRDFFREEAGLVGNMGAREAVQLAARTGVHTLVPMHWDLMAGNTERPGAVLDEVIASGIDLHVLTLARQRPYRLA